MMVYSCKRDHGNCARVIDNSGGGGGETISAASCIRIKTENSLCMTARRLMRYRKATVKLLVQDNNY